MATITELPKTSLTFEQKLDRLAQVAVNVGLGLERGQELVMTATLDALPLARLITEQAYKAGASLVTTLFTDEPSTLLRYRYADDAGFATSRSGRHLPDIPASKLTSTWDWRASSITSTLIIIYFSGNITAVVK